jgi:hypothetical protein
MYYGFNGVDVNGDTAVDLSPIPDTTYSLRFNCILRTPELSADTDEVGIPTLPIIHLAVALAVAERGESGGNSAAELLNVANKILSDAIALDGYKHPEELVYRAV